jgi:hypothetical protein
MVILLIAPNDAFGKIQEIVRYSEGKRLGNASLNTSKNARVKNGVLATSSAIISCWRMDNLTIQVKSEDRSTSIAAIGPMPPMGGLLLYFGRRNIKLIKSWCFKGFDTR